MEEEIQQYLRFHPLSSRSELMEGVNTKVSVATFKRLLAAMISAGSIEVIGQGPATCYKLTPQTFVTSYFDLESYFRKLSISALFLIYCLMLTLSRWMNGNI